MGRHWFTRIVMVGAIASGWPIAAAAQDAADSGPTVEVFIRTMKRDGGVSMSGNGNNPFVPGATQTWFLSAGSSNPSEMTVCGGGVGETGTLAEKLARNAFVWELKLLPVKYEHGSATLDLSWARYQADGGGRPAAEGKSTLTLKEGDRQPIDFVHGAAGANCRDDSAIVEVGTGYREPRALAQSILQYDLWLKHQSAGGETIVRRFTAMGGQGSDVDFTFVPLQFAVAQPTPDRAAYDLLTTVRGTVKGRLMPNGRIALTVDTTRRDGVGARGAASGGSSGNTGRKVLDVAPDEPIEIELPLPGGRSTIRTGGGAAARPATPALASNGGVSFSDGRLVVEHARFFQGQRTSLIVQVKPVRQ